MYVVNNEKQQGWYVNGCLILPVEAYPHNKRYDWIRYVAKNVPQVANVTDVIRSNEFNTDVRKSIIDRIVHEIEHFLNMVADQ